MFVIVAIPSIATIFSSIPFSFSSSVKEREESPISVVFEATASRPAPDPVNCASNCKFGYFSLIPSDKALTNFSIEVDPFKLTFPLMSSDALFDPPPHPAKPRHIMKTIKTLNTFFFIFYLPSFVFS